MKLLVTGCGRSGTTWMLHCLRAAGLPAIGEHGRTWQTVPFDGNAWDVDVSWRLAPFTPWPDAYVVHIVRHPLDVIRSRLDTGNFAPGKGMGAYARKWCPGMNTTDDLTEAIAWHWVQWNRLVVADEVLRLEDVDAIAISRLASMVDPRAHLEALPAPVNVTDPAERGRAVPWSRVAQVPGLLARAARYGYGPEDGR